ncbi:MAG: MFS transporter [Candidatus Aureabacteria bacterium]|nr:MFS transporter [Candidatus Auribacterota bacterium]
MKRFFQMTDAHTSQRIHYAWIILIMGTLGVFGALGLARFGYTVVLPSMQEGLHMDNTQAGILATANLIGYLALCAIGGALASRFGPRSVLSIGLFLCAASMILTGLVNDMQTAAVFRAVTGLGSGAANISVMGMMSAWFTAKRRGFASGIAVSGSSLALIVLGPLVPRILSSFQVDGWRVCWFVFGGITLLLSLASFFLIRNHPEEKGLEPLGKNPGTTFVEREKKESVQWRRVYRSFPVWNLGLVYVAFGFSYIIYMTFFTKKLVAEGGYSQLDAGKLFMIMGWLSLFCGLIWGSISDRIGRKQTLAAVYFVQAVSFSLFALWTKPFGFTLSAILFGLTAWSIPAVMAAACGDMLGSRMAPAALGFITLFFGVGQAVGPSIAGIIADFYGSFSPAFLLAGIVALLGSIGSFFLKPERRES